MRNFLVGWMAKEIATEKVACFNVVDLQKCSQIVTGKTGPFSDCDDVAEPGGIRIPRGSGENEAIFMVYYRLCEFLEILLTAGNEVGEFLELGAADGGLHVGNFEIVTNMTVNVFVVIAIGQRAELLAETFAACVVLTACAVTITAPVAD